MICLERLSQFSIMNEDLFDSDADNSDSDDFVTVGRIFDKYVHLRKKT